MKKLFFLGGIILSVILLVGWDRKKDSTLDLWQLLDKKATDSFQNYEIEKACQYWQEAIKRNPDNLTIYNKLGISFLLLKEYDKAIDILENGLTRSRENLALNYNLALSYYYSGNIKMALEQVEIVLNLNNLYPNANYLKGLCLENMGRFKESELAYLEELNNNPGSPMVWKKIRKKL